jgi:MFS superfamily sulfate permease-like transporter
MVTFTLTVLVDLVAAVLVGVVLSMALRRWARR